MRRGIPTHIRRLPNRFVSETPVARGSSKLPRPVGTAPHITVPRRQVCGALCCAVPHRLLVCRSAGTGAPAPQPGRSGRHQHVRWVLAAAGSLIEEDGRLRWPQQGTDASIDPLFHLFGGRLPGIGEERHRPVHREVRVICSDPAWGNRADDPNAPLTLLPCKPMRLTQKTRADPAER